MVASILSFGRYIPSGRIKALTIAEHWKKGMEHIEALGIEEKSVPNSDENAFTLAHEAATLALKNINRSDVGACFVGSESHPYAVKPTSGMLVSSLGINAFSHSADLEFACKAGTASMQLVKAMVESKQITMGLAIGTDTAQSRPGDALEYSAAAGAAAFVIGKPSKQCPALATIDITLSYTTDTPDFWRANGEQYPSHAGRFTGEPGYFHHMETIFHAFMKKIDRDITSIDHVVLHMPNAKFPKQFAKKVGITEKQLSLGFIVPFVGNTYSACSPLGLTFVLEKAKKDETILLISYGSGSGCDAFLFTMQRDGESLSPSSTPLRYLTYSDYMQIQRPHS